VRRIARDAAPGDYTWSAIITGIVKSTPFSMAGGGQEPERTTGEQQSTRQREDGRGAIRPVESHPPELLISCEKGLAMIISKMAIPRRTVLRGMGSMLALPLLDSMMPRLSALQTSAARPINRFGVMYVPNGMIMKNYLPLTEGRDFELTPTLSALAPFREHILVLSGLECVPTPGRPGGAHAKASTRFLTDVSPPLSETWLDAGISMDQILAQETGKRTQIASLELAMESGETAGACDTGFACPYT